MLRIPFLIGLLFTVFETLSQSGYRFQNISVSDGLSQNTVTVIYEDSRGFMWFGTQDGLNRYDGVEFKVFKSNNSSASLSDNFITAIAEDTNGQMWIGTRSGLNRLDPATGQCVRFPTINRETFHSTVSQIICLSDGKVFSNEVGVGNIILQNAIDYNKSILVNTKDNAMCQLQGILCIIQKNGTIQSYDPKETIPFSNTGLHNTIGIETNGAQFVSWNADTLRIQENSSVLEIPIPYPIRDVVFCKNQWWIATNNDLYVYNSSLKVVQPHVLGNPALRLTGDDIHSFVIDSFGQLWFGSNRHGAFFLPAQAADFVHISGLKLDDPIVWSAAVIDSTLFIGTSIGVEAYSWHHYPSIDPLDPFQNLAKQQSWKGFHAASMHVVDNQLYVGTRDGQILIIRKNGATWEIEERLLIQETPQIFSITSDSNQLIASTSEGLIRSLDGLSFEPLYPLDSEVRKKSYFLHVSVDSDNNYILSSTDGLVIYNTQSTNATELPFLQNSNGIGFPVIASTLPIADQMLICTMGRGLDRMDKQGVFSHWTANQGLRNEVVYGGVLSNFNDLWLCTNDGLSILKDDKIVANYSTEDGVPFTEHSQNAFGQFEDFMWFGGINGMYLLDRNIQLLAANRRLLINEILINNAPIGNNNRHIEGTIFNPKKISLYPTDNSLIFDFALLSIGGQTERMAYRLEGVDQDWIVVNTKNHRIQYTTLPSGNHTLEIATIDFNQEIQHILLRLPIVVYPPFWQTLWFGVIAVVMLIVLIAAIIRAVARRRIQIQLQKEETQRKIQEERERISMDLHDNIGAQITHVITSLDNLSYKISDGQDVNTVPVIDELGDFARGTMQQLRDTIWTLKKDDVYLDQFIDRIQDYLRRMFQDHDHLHMQIEMRIENQIQLPAATTVHLFRIMQEIATNVVKHSEATHFSLVFTNHDKWLMIEVKDNGKGFNQEEIPMDHYGIKNIRSRINELGGRMRIESEIGRTYYNMEIPIR